MRKNWVLERARAVSLFEDGYGRNATAKLLGISKNTVAKWLYAYRARGKEALLSRKLTIYSQETKLSAVLDVLDNGMTKPDVMEKYGIKSITQIRDWCRLYESGGEDALAPKKKGRKPRPANPEYASREEELEARIEELELENALLKRINALADEIEQKRHPR